MDSEPVEGTSSLTIAAHRSTLPDPSVEVAGRD
jgi:hypothetical protein